MDVCLGDVVILPFVASDTGHAFRLTRRGPPMVLPPPSAVQAQPGADTVPNPAAPHLRFISHQTATLPHRHAGAVTYDYYVDFVADAPGRLNLSVHTRPGVPTSLVAASGSVPVVVVPRGEPVTVLLVNEQVRHYHETRPFASTSGNQYLTDVLLLQPGDRISLQYGGFTWRDTPSRPSPPRPRPLEAAPVIARLPFAVDRARRFNAWIADHLPADGGMRSAGCAGVAVDGCPAGGGDPGRRPF